MKLIIDKKILNIFSDVLIGVLVVKNVNNTKQTEEITKLLREAEAQAINMLGNTPIIEQPYIKAWREAYREFGAKPSDYPSSIENLLRRIQKGETLRHINSLVDIYNIISLKHFIPVGGEDLKKIVGDIQLTVAGENEAPTILLGEKEPRAPHNGEVIYKDDAGTLCRRWNWKEADRTKLTDSTTEAILVMEALSPYNAKYVQTALSELGELIDKYCGKVVIKDIMNISKSEILIL